MSQNKDLELNFQQMQWLCIFSVSEGVCIENFKSERGSGLEAGASTVTSVKIINRKPVSSRQSHFVNT